MSNEIFNEHPELPVPESPSLTVEEIVGERVASFDDLDEYDLASEAIEPVSSEDEERILERYLQLKEQEETLARVRAFLLEAIKTLPQEAPQTFVSNASEAQTNHASPHTQKEEAELPPSDSEKPGLF